MKIRRRGLKDGRGRAIWTTRRSKNGAAARRLKPRMTGDDWTRSKRWKQALATEAARPKQDEADHRRAAECRQIDA